MTSLCLFTYPPKIIYRCSGKKLTRVFNFLLSAIHLPSSSLKSGLWIDDCDIRGDDVYPALLYDIEMFSTACNYCYTLSIGDKYRFGLGNKIISPCYLKNNYPIHPIPRYGLKLGNLVSSLHFPS